MKVELFYIDGCRSCTAAKDELKAAVLDAGPEVTWREIDAVKELDYAVELGVASLPSVAIDGKVVFTSLPTPEVLCKVVLTKHREASSGH